MDNDWQTNYEQKGKRSTGVPPGGPDENNALLAFLAVWKCQSSSDIISCPYAIQIPIAAPYLISIWLGNGKNNIFLTYRSTNSFRRSGRDRMFFTSKCACWVWKHWYFAHWSRLRCCCIILRCKWSCFPQGSSVKLEFHPILNKEYVRF